MRGVSLRHGGKAYQHGVSTSPPCNSFTPLLPFPPSHTLVDTRHIKMFVLDEADEMLSRGFKDQIYDVFRKLPSTIQVQTGGEGNFPQPSRYRLGGKETSLNHPGTDWGGRNDTLHSFTIVTLYLFLRSMDGLGMRLVIFMTTTVMTCVIVIVTTSLHDTHSPPTHIMTMMVVTYVIVTTSLHDTHSPPTHIMTMMVVTYVIVTTSLHDTHSPPTHIMTMMVVTYVIVTTSLHDTLTTHPHHDHDGCDLCYCHYLSA